MKDPAGEFLREAPQSPSDARSTVSHVWGSGGNSALGSEGASTQSIPAAAHFARSPSRSRG